MYWKESIMSLAILKILPAAVITFWAFRIFFRKDVFKMQLLMVIGMLMSVILGKNELLKS